MFLVQAIPRDIIYELFIRHKQQQQKQPLQRLTTLRKGKEGSALNSSLLYECKINGSKVHSIPSSSIIVNKGDKRTFL